MSAWFYIALCMAAVSLVLVLCLWRQRRQLHEVHQERESIVGEERRMFDFLHGLGEALTHDNPREKMYRLIVEGISTVADASGGAIYMHDSEKGMLQPVMHSASCPPVITLPERIIERARTNPQTLKSFLRLHSIGEQDGILGEVFQSQQPLRVADLRDTEYFQKVTNTFQQHVTAMIAPLSSGIDHYGVLVVSDDRLEKTFTDNDYEVFLSLVEQSSYAITSARIHQEAIEKRKIENELRNASEIQRVLLPESDPELKEYRFAAINLPARVLSGDYYDYIAIDQDRYGVTLGDVSGKGLPASLVAAITRSVLRANAGASTSPAKVLAKVNRVIFPDIREDMFITKVYAILDRQSDEIVIARAGHNPPLYFDCASGEVREIAPRGMAIGVDSGNVFDRVISEERITMKRGDCLLLYTDGVSEAVDVNGREYDVPRLIEEYTKSAAGGARKIVEHLEATLKEFTKGLPQADDITLIAIEKR